jgi:DNA-binding NtrC family response regulator
MTIPERATILVVEDEPLLRILILDILVDEGFAVLEAANVTQATEALNRGERIDVLLTDVRMPGPFDGLELARRVTVLRPEVAVLVMSAWIDSASTPLPEGCAFIAKPYAPAALITAIGTLLATRRAAARGAAAAPMPEAGSGLLPDPRHRDQQARLTRTLRPASGA